MKEERITFLKTLINSISPSGFEKEAAEIWKNRAKSLTDKVRTDRHGNSIATLNEEGKPRVMLAGHIDEVGFMVKYIDAQGFLYFAAIGGIDLQIPQGQRVWIKTKKEKITGVIGKKPIHLLEDEERKKVPKIEELWVDIGAKDKKEAEELVNYGDPIVFSYEFSELRNSKITGRGFDDRIGAFTVLEALGELKDSNIKASLFSVATVQEEIGLRGAKTSAFGINPDIGIAVDVTFATDSPGVDKKRIGEISLGKGPVIARGPNINPKVYELLIKTAEEENIPYQIEGIPRGTGTDANVIQLTRAGVAAGLVSIPNRYMHTPCEIVDTEDVENGIKLLSLFIKRLIEDIDLTPF